MGDPAGIGPEIIVGAWTETGVQSEWCRPLVVGNAEILRRRGSALAAEREGGGDRFAGIGPAFARGDSMLVLRLIGRAGRGPRHARRPGGPGGLRCGYNGLAFGSGWQRWMPSPLVAEKEWAASGRTRLSGTHRIACLALRRRRFCHDALHGAGRRHISALRIDRGSRHLAYRAATRRDQPAYGGGDFGQSPAGRLLHVQIDASGRARKIRSKQSRAMHARVETIPGKIGCGSGFSH